MILRVATAAAIAASMMSTPAMARDTLSLAGSSTVFPFATIVGERLGRNPAFKTPVIESTGSSHGKKTVCEGSIDFGNASSRMKKKDVAFCEKNGVAVTEIKVGYDGIVVANSKEVAPLEISMSDLGKALAANVAVNGKMVANPYKTWADVNAALPNVAIKVMGPPTTSGTRASFEEMVLEKAFCGKDKAIEALGKDAEKACLAMRTDGAYIEAGENDNLIVQKLAEDKDAYGIFGFSYLDQNSDTVQGAIVGGVEPSMDTIAAGKYPISRALWFYANHASKGVVPGFEQYMAEWTKYWDEGNILQDAGMIPMPTEERAKYAKAMKELPVLKQSDLPK